MVAGRSRGSRLTKAKGKSKVEGRVRFKTNWHRHDTLFRRRMERRASGGGRGNIMTRRAKVCGM